MECLFNAASYRLLQLVAELDDEAPWGTSKNASAPWCNTLPVSRAITTMMTAAS